MVLFNGQQLHLQDGRLQQAQAQCRPLVRQAHISVLPDPERACRMTGCSRSREEATTLSGMGLSSTACQSSGCSAFITCAMEANADVRPGQQPHPQRACSCSAATQANMSVTDQPGQVEHRPPSGH